jgi:hypothetical protein
MKDIFEKVKLDTFGPEEKLKFGPVYQTSREVPIIQPCASLGVHYLGPNMKLYTM